MKADKHLINIVITALFAAIITVTTAYIFHIPVGVNNGYIHVGDCFIYLAACFLPLPYAMLAGAIGGGLADFLTGATIWVIPTVIIKSLLTIPFTSKTEKIINKRNILALFIGTIITTGGYYIAEAIIVHNWIAPLATLAVGLIQPIGSGILFVIIGAALDKSEIKSRLLNLK